VVKRARLTCCVLLASSCTVAVVGCDPGGTQLATVTGVCTCVPGRSVECAGPNGCKGQQVCADDGRRYLPCDCSGNPPADDQPPAGGAGAGAGGAGSGQLCGPVDLPGFFPPPYRPANLVQNVCTPELVQQNYNACIKGEPQGECDLLFREGGAQEACGACLMPTLRDAVNYGPLLKLMNTSETFFAYETNTAGCLELKGDIDCAQAVQGREFCLRTACYEYCPPDNAQLYEESYIPCKQRAAEGTCASFVEAAGCILDSPAVDACLGEDFESTAVKIGIVFCAGG
jgi:hypothetical protein